VSLLQSCTEIVAALGATEALAGVDAYSTFPDAVKRLPKVGSYLQPDLEAIVRLRPMFVIVDDVHGQVAAALHDHDIATVGCSARDLPDVRACLRAVGGQLGKTREAEQVAAAIDAALAGAAARRPAHHPRVLAIIDREPAELGNLVAAGPGSYVDELLAVVGGDNVLVDLHAEYPKISVEEVLRARPEVIVDLSEAARAGNNAWQGLNVPAVASGRVVAIAEPYLMAPSPRVALALDALARAIR
jgi:iron complex transport system substrate-binding protein